MGGRRPWAGRPGSARNKADLLDEIEATNSAREEANRAVEDAMQETAAVLRLASGVGTGLRGASGSKEPDGVVGGLTGIEGCARAALERRNAAHAALREHARGSGRPAARR